MGLDELRGLLAHHGRPDQSTPIDDVLISKVERSTPPSQSMSGTVMALVAQGAKRIALGHRVYEYRAGQYLVASVDLPITGQFIEVSPERPALGVGMILRPAAVAELLLQAAPGDLPPARDEPDPVSETDPASAGPAPARHPPRRRHRRQPPRRLRQPVTVQPCTRATNGGCVGQQVDQARHVAESRCIEQGPEQSVSLRWIDRTAPLFG